MTAFVTEQTLSDKDGGIYPAFVINVFCVASNGKILNVTRGIDYNLAFLAHEGKDEYIKNCISDMKGYIRTEMGLKGLTEKQLSSDEEMDAWLNKERKA